MDSIEEAISDLRAGKMLVVVDDPGRENQGDIIFPTQTATLGKVQFLLNECRGMVCVALSREQAVKLNLNLMVSPHENTEVMGGQFTVSVDSREVKDYGISARDRLQTIKTLGDKNSVEKDLARPGHVFPLIANDKGMLSRQGHTEATIDLCRLAGFEPAGVLCEILNNKGEIANSSELKAFAKKNKLKIVSTNDIYKYLEKNPLPTISCRSVVKTASTTLPTEYGTFKLTVYKSIVDNREHVLLRMGNDGSKPVLTRVHSQCITGDTFHSLKCDCYPQLEASFKMIAKEKQGIIIYLNQEGRDIGLTNKIKAYALQEKGLDTVEANEALGLPVDRREYTMVADILREQEIDEIRLITNNPSKVSKLSANGVKIFERISIHTEPQTHNLAYLKTKKNKLGHQLKDL